MNNITLLPKKVRCQLYMEIHELEFPLKHPLCVLDEKIYKQKLDILLRGNWIVRTFQLRRIESFIYRMFSFFNK